MLGVFAVASAAAQDAVFLVESTHKANFALHAGNTSQWNVYKVNEWTDQKDAVPADNDKLNGDDDFLFVGDNSTSSEIEITWKNPGKYYLIVEEFNGAGGCSSRRPIAIEVVGNASIAFAVATSNDCASVGDSFSTQLSVETKGIADDKFFPITVSYRLPGDSSDRQVEIADNRTMTVTGLTIDDEFSESNHIITISSAVDKYGGDINVIKTDDAHVHTRTLYALPVIEDFTY